MDPKAFENLLKELDYLTDLERGLYYSMFVASPEETKKKIEEFFLNQKQKLSQINKTYNEKIKATQEEFQKEAEKITRDLPRPVSPLAVPHLT